jgi:hypothetical protein
MRGEEEEGRSGKRSVMSFQMEESPVGRDDDEEDTIPKRLIMVDLTASK